jgi:integrase
MRADDRLDTLLRRYLAEHLIDSRPGTRAKHESSIRWLERILGRPAKVADLNDANLGRMMHELANRRRSKATINGYRGKLLALWSWACRQGWIKKWPTVRKLVEPKKNPVAWSPAELRQLWQSLEKLPGTIAGVPAPLWWQAYHLVAWDTGERHSARMALRWESFSDLAAGRGLFPAETRKGAVADLAFQLHPATAELLGQIRSLGADRPHPWDRSPLYFYARYAEVLRAAGLPADRAHQSHCLRRSFATHLAARGVARADVSAHLGQTDMAVVRRYIDVTQVAGVHPCDVLFRLGD